MNLMKGERRYNHYGVHIGDFLIEPGRTDHEEYEKRYKRLEEHLEKLRGMRDER